MMLLYEHGVYCVSARAILSFALMLVLSTASASAGLQTEPSPVPWGPQRVALGTVKVPSPLLWDAERMALDSVRAPAPLSLKTSRLSVRKGLAPLKTLSPLSWDADRAGARRQWELRMASPAPRWHRHRVHLKRPATALPSHLAPGNDPGTPRAHQEGHLRAHHEGTPKAHEEGSRGGTSSLWGTSRAHGKGTARAHRWGTSATAGEGTAATHSISESHPEGTSAGAHAKGRGHKGGHHIPRAPEAITAGRRQMRAALSLPRNAHGTPETRSAGAGNRAAAVPWHTGATPQAAAVARRLAQLKAGRSVAQQMAEIRRKGFGRIVITQAQAKWLVRQGKGPSSDSLAYYVVEARGHLMLASRLLVGQRHPCGSPVLGDAAFALLNALFLMLQGGRDRGAGFHQMLVVDGVTLRCVQMYSTPKKVGRAVRTAHDFIVRATKWLQLHPDTAAGGAATGGKGGSKGGKGGGGGGGGRGGGGTGGGGGGGGGKPKPKGRSPPIRSGTPPVSLQGGSTGNPIDDCWMGDPQWGSDNNRKALAVCARGYGQNAVGGAEGPVYVVTTTEDDPVNPPPGSLRYGATRDGPLWIVFAGDMEFKLQFELYVSSHKTIDGRGAKVSFSNGQCIELVGVSNVIIHGINFYKCARRLGSAKIRISEGRVRGFKHAQGNSLSLVDSRDVWVDHCAFDGIQHKDNKHINVKQGSTGVTISNSRFSNTDYVMLLGHNDTFVADRGMRVSIILNLFAENLTQRMPRCRFGDFHVVNNNYPYGWSMYAIGGSSGPTILSEANYFVASSHKEVTKRNALDPEMMKDSANWNWKSRGDMFKNGAFFRESGSQPALKVPYKYGVIDASDVPKAPARAGPLTCTIGSPCA